MLFSEIYSCYYNAVAKIIAKGIEGELDHKAIKRIVRENAFAESAMDIPDALSSGRWPLLYSDNSPVLADVPNMPLTELEKRWLKSLLSDPRVKLFGVSDTGLQDVKPLYEENAFVKFDMFEDGDPYGNPEYIENFRRILFAIKNKRLLNITFNDSRGQRCESVCLAEHLEYSFKNDRFRAIAASESGNMTINLSRIVSCELLSKTAGEGSFCVHRVKKELTAELLDVNDALNRAMISFSYLEKETSKIDDNRYLLTLRYYEEDEAEIRIQILSFGTNLRVISPTEFIGELNKKIVNQKKLRAFF